jgi:hypothetical protein
MIELIDYLIIDYIKYFSNTHFSFETDYIIEFLKLSLNCLLISILFSIPLFILFYILGNNCDVFDNDFKMSISSILSLIRRSVLSALSILIYIPSTFCLLLCVFICVISLLCLILGLVVLGMTYFINILLSFSISDRITLVGVIIGIIALIVACFTLKYQKRVMSCNKRNRKKQLI